MSGLEGWALIVAVVAIGVSLGLAAVIVQLTLEAWQARHRRRRQVTDKALRAVEQSQTPLRIRQVIEAEQRRRLGAAAQTGRRE